MLSINKIIKHNKMLNKFCLNFKRSNSPYRVRRAINN